MSARNLLASLLVAPSVAQGARNSKSLPDRNCLALFDAGLAREETENRFLRTGGWSWR
jgi:hypothetical protein